MPTDSEPVAKNIATASIALPDSRVGWLFGKQRLARHFERYNPDDLVGRHGLAIYDEMRRDEQVKAAIRLKKAAIIGPGWKLDAASEDGPDVELRDRIADDLDALPGPVSEILSGMLSALDYGFSLTELVFTLDRAESRLRLAKLQSIAPHGITFRQAQDGALQDIRQEGNPDPMPPGKFIHYAHEGEFGNPYGCSDLRAAHRSWWHRVNWIQWLAVWGEKLADAPIVIKYAKGSSAAEVATARATAENLQARTVLTVPEGWEISPFDQGRDPKSVFVEVIDHYGLEIGKALLIPDKMGLVGGAVDGGSFSLSKTQMGVFLFVIELEQRSLEACVQEQLINRVAALMDPAAVPPTFSLLPLAQEDTAAIATAWNTIMGGGGMPESSRDWNHTRMLLGYPELSPEEVAEALAAKEQAREDMRERLAGGGGEPGKAAEDKAPADDDEADDEPAADDTELTAMPAGERGARTQPSGPFWRPLRPSEAHVDMAARLLDFEAGTSAATTILGDLATDLAADLRARIAKLLNADALTPNAVRDLAAKPSIGKRHSGRMESVLRSSFERGIQGARDDVVALRATSRDVFVQLSADLIADLELVEPGLIGRLAQRFFRAKAFYMTGILEQDLLARAQAVLFNALKGDKLPRTILAELDEAVADYVPVRDRAGREVNVPHRLETTARTNLAEAVNEGRFQYLTRPELADVVRGLEYSAILDDRTRANHAAWDGVRREPGFWLGPPDRRPPNGFNCRCSLFPITLTDEAPLTDEAALPAVVLTDKGFR